MARLDRIPGVKRLLAKTRRRLRDIALWRAFWPLVVIVSVFLIAALLGQFERAPDQIAAFATLLVFAGTLIALLRGLRRFRAPPLRAANDALDVQDELRPLASLADRPARPSVAGVALWRAHQVRLTDAVRRLRVPRFSAIWKQIDPLYMRFVLPLALVGLIALNGAQTHTKLASALTPDYGSLMGADTIQIEAWITPPTHTGRAPIFLKTDQDDVRVPSGSIMTLRVQAPSTPKLRTLSDQDRKTARFTKTPDGAYETEAIITADTTVSVRWWGERRSWSILASPDAVPKAIFVDVPIRDLTDRTAFTWEVSDDYGVASLDFAIRPEGSTRDPDLVAIDLGGVSLKTASEEVALDLTRNRWAGARVEVQLLATDGAGQVGRSEPHVFVMPEKLLLQPLAKAVQDIRVTVLREDDLYAQADLAEDALQQGGYYTSATQRIDLAPAGVKRGAVMLDAVTYEAPRYFKDILVYTGLRSAQRTLEAASALDEAKATDPLLWAVALRAEYGTAADALARLQAARQALENALRDGASEEEIARLVEAFKDAAQNYVAALMAEALANGLDGPPDTRDSAQQGGGQGLGGDDFSDMLDALQDLTETGASDQARQLLADITNMLENLEIQQGNGSGSGFPGMPGQPGEGDDEDVPEEERELTETMRELSDLLRRQRELNDETLAQQRGEGSQFDQPSGPEGHIPGEPPLNQPDAEGGTSLADRQEALGDLVEELARRNGAGGDEEDGAGAGLDGETLDAIERAQRRAGQALDDGNELRALRNQEQATRQLRDLAEGLAQDLDAVRAERLGDTQRAAEGAGSDPFGNSSTGGIDDSNSVDIPDQAERQRARDILDELRKRYGDTVDEDERNYLERLLDRF